MAVTREQIASTIRAMGVREPDLLIAHSSFKSFGSVEGGPEAVALALIDSISPGGSLFMPSFNYGELAYDARTTRSLTGAITEVFRNMADVARSDHPTHAVAGYGPDAAAILGDHQPLNVFGRGSPLGRLWERNAWVLLIGCDHRSNSMIHVAEELIHVGYVPRTRVGHILRNDAEEEIVVRRPGCSDNFNVVDQLMRSGGSIIDSRIGSSKLMLMRSGNLVRIVSDLLRADPAALLCGSDRCPACEEARRMLH